jgi:multicomponent Na+:H+ antiporter subunit E
MTFRQRAIVFLNELPLFLGLVFLWAALWGEFTWLSLLTGTVVAALVSIGFYLPAVELSGRINVFWLLVFGVRLVVDIARASIEVAALALSPRYRASNAIIAVQLRSRSDLILTWTAVSTSIVPGSLVIDVDRAHSILFLHVLNMADKAEADRFKLTVLDTERRLLLALGSRDDADRVRRRANAGANDERGST